MKDIAKIGIPLAVQGSAEFVSGLGMALMAGHLGTSELDSLEIANQFIFLPLLAGFAIQMANSVYANRFSAAGNVPGQKSTLQKSLLLGLIIPISTLPAAIFGSDGITKLFVNNDDKNTTNSDFQEVSTLNKHVLPIAAVGLSTDVVRRIISESVIAQKDTKSAVLINVSTATGLSLLLSYLMGDYWLGIDGIYIGQSVALALSSTFLTAKFLRNVRANAG